jgi:hypothetical protein
MKKQAIFSMRLNRDMKRALEDQAREEKCSVSSLVENILSDNLANRGIEWNRMEHRRYPRKEIEMPARFQIPGRKVTDEHDVHIKNISQTGAYAISSDIRSIQKLLKNKGLSVEAKLLINLPNWEEPLVLNCQVVRMALDRNIAGIGLEYTDIEDREQFLINLLAAV